MAFMSLHCRCFLIMLVQITVGLIQQENHIRLFADCHTPFIHVLFEYVNVSQRFKCRNRNTPGYTPGLNSTHNLISDSARYTFYIFHATNSEHDSKANQNLITSIKMPDTVGIPGKLISHSLMGQCSARHGMHFLRSDDPATRRERA